MSDEDFARLWAEWYRDFSYELWLDEGKGND